MSIRFAETSHWYGKDGKPQHESTLRDARKTGLYRSVTSIDKDIFKNEFLEKYKMERIAEAAFNNPRQPHEQVDDYSTRLWELSLEHASDASSFGTEFHKGAEGKPVSGAMQPFIDKYNIWKQENIIQVVTHEKVLLDHDIGVAGTMDTRMVHKTHGLVTADFKTQGIKTDKRTGKKNKANFYDSFIRQLAFYDSVEAKAAGSFPALGPCLSIVIDSTEATTPHERLWTKAETLAAYEDFLIAVYAYYKRKNYWPVGNWKLEDKLLQLR